MRGGISSACLSPLVIERSEPLRYTGLRTPEVLAAYVAETYGQHGRLESPRQPSSGAVRFSIRRPGTTVDVEVPGAGDTIKLSERVVGSEAH